MSNSSPTGLQNNDVKIASALIANNPKEWIYEK